MKFPHHMLACIGISLMTSVAVAQQPGNPVELKIRQARQNPFASEKMLLAATHAGDTDRIVAVGDHGTVLVSDDGKHFHQARSVPVRSTLTSVSFADTKNGWAVGHWGVILNTNDGGETWALQRSDTTVDRPFFAVHFMDDQHGVAAGLWSLLMTTNDGGKTWNEVKLDPPPEAKKADRNLFGIFRAGNSLFIPAERGLVLRSDDQGLTWKYLETGYAGSLWCGIALSNDTILVGGLRGTIYRSDDNGKKWLLVSSGTKSSITGFTRTGNKIVAVGLDGVVATSSDQGFSFQAIQREDRLALTAVVGSQPLGISKHGILVDLLK